MVNLIQQQSSEHKLNVPMWKDFIYINIRIIML